MGIKKGDLVMVVKPTACCGNPDSIGSVFVAAGVHVGTGRCRWCKAVDGPNRTAIESGARLFPVPRLKKIDPPADGDSLPTRADIEVAA